MQKFNKACQILAMIALLLSAATQAEVAVIVSPGNANTHIDQETIARVFLGKTKNFPDGSQAVPVDQSSGSDSRETFNAVVLGKSASQLKAYWSRLIFTGKGTPPKESGDDTAVKALISKNPNMIGYIDSSAVDDSVKVVYQF